MLHFSLPFFVRELSIWQITSILIFEIMCSPGVGWTYSKILANTASQILSLKPMNFYLMNHFWRKTHWPRGTLSLFILETGGWQGLLFFLSSSLMPSNHINQLFIKTNRLVQQVCLDFLALALPAHCTFVWCIFRRNCTYGEHRQILSHQKI